VTTYFDLERIFLLSLLVARAAGLVAVAPFLGERMVPVRVRALFAVILGFLMLTVAPAAPPVPESLLGLVLATLTELSVGLAVGYVARLAVLAFEMSGHVVAVQMGFGIASVFDPLQGHQANILGRWMWILGMVLFLGLNGHHHMLRAVAGTLDVLPPGAGLLSTAAVETIVDAGAECLVSAMRIGAPAVGVLLLTTVGLGLLARTVPQMNVFIVGFPIKITAGLVALLLSMPYLLEVARREVGALAHRLSALVQA
jgi:flagellar biosynthetic protein FliR